MRSWVPWMMLLAGLGSTTRAEGAGPAEATGSSTTAAAPGEQLPLAAIHRPLVLPTDLVAVSLQGTFLRLGGGVRGFQVSPTLDYGVGERWALSLRMPGLVVATSPTLSPDETTTEVEVAPMVLGADVALYRDAVDLAAGARLELPLYGSRRFASALFVALKAVPASWLGLTTGAALYVYDGQGIEVGVELPLALTAQLSERVALTVASGLRIDDGARVPLGGGLEVALGEDHAGATVGAAFSLPSFLVLGGEGGGLVSELWTVSGTVRVFW